ncbi:MAG TPA: aldolase/citrate lyase family protein [Paracoccaceae bacterium]|nr:aldolase/citrate lyase family protein [Paracoccaceae bacterium]
MRLKKRLSETQDKLANFIVTIPSAVVTQALAAAGADSLIIDIEHGAVDYGSAHSMIAATRGFECAPLVRIAENTDAQVKRALDLGAEGIVFPLIETAEQAAWAVSSLRYPPHGRRTFGPFIAHSHEGVPLAAYADHVDDTLTCCLLVETVKGVENIQDICAVPGIDIIIPAAFDLSTSLGIPGQFEAPAFLEALAKIEAAALAAGIPMGGNAFSQEQADKMFARGYRLLGGFDVLMLKAGVTTLRGWCG